MQKTRVNGPKTDPIVAKLKRVTVTDKVDVGWNFKSKFLVSRDGVHVHRVEEFDPLKLRAEVREMLREHDHGPDHVHEEDDEEEEEGDDYDEEEDEL